MIPGITERLKKELAARFSTDRLNVVSPPEREYLTWIGGSILGSLATFQQMWIAKRDYDESGASIIYRNSGRGATTYRFS